MAPSATPDYDSEVESLAEELEEVEVDNLSDADLVDEDAVPKQKIEVDNKVCGFMALKWCEC